MKRTIQLDYNSFVKLVNDGDLILWDNGDIARVKKLNNSIVFERNGSKVPFTIEQGFTIESYIFNEKQVYYHVVERENSSAFKIIK